ASRPWQESHLPRTTSSHCCRVAGATGRAARLDCSSRTFWPVCLHRGRTDFCRRHRHLRHGNNVSQDAVESSQGFTDAVLCDEGGPLVKLIIVGGVAGGASAAARARRLSEDSHIILFERGPDVSFANCGLPYYLGGEITERDKLLVVTPERLQTRLKLD